ncbi:protein FAM177A1 isoform X2 [Trachypithecus francoisi]|uniref:protein FAM177A1 isoform X2 n=1 Tax=Trachypithecus francoisi TaxID=54180 RepID=UPI00141AB260|nr:protein FAM177A1 isoform X2 [Trachypithecus francoisi]
MRAWPEATPRKAPPRPARAGSCASQTAVGQVSGCEARQARRGAGRPRPSGRPHPSRPASHFPRDLAGRGARRARRASSPVVATTMDQEPVGRVEREAVAAAGLAAAAAFGESAGQTKLTWGPYLWFYMLRAATSTLSVCDFLGEKIASVLGISTPKYQYAIDEYYRMKKEEEEEEEENRISEEAERQYQQNKLQTDSNVQTDQPETAISSSFVNVNFEMEGDSEVIMESKQNPVSVPP